MLSEHGVGRVVAPDGKIYSFEVCMALNGPFAEPTCNNIKCISELLVLCIQGEPERVYMYIIYMCIHVCLQYFAVLCV